MPRVEVIPFGVNTREFFPRDRLEARRVLRLPEDGVVLLVLGRLSEEHKADLEPLLIVARELIRKSPNLWLCIAGHEPDGSGVSETESLAARLGIRKHLRFLLNFQDFLKSYIYSAADILVAPSDNIQETFGIAVLEAMACGLPVVASDWSGYRDLVIHGKTGFLAPTIWSDVTARDLSRHSQFLTDEARRHMLAQQTVVDPSEMHRCLETLVGNAEMRKSFGERAIERVNQEYRWEKVIEVHENLWRDLWAVARAVPGAESSTAEDYDAIFGSLASSRLNLDDVVGRSPMRADIESALHSRPPKPGYNLIDHENIRRIAERTRKGPVSIRQLIEEGTIPDTTAIVWLMKKAYLKKVLT